MMLMQGQHDVCLYMLTQAQDQIPLLYSSVLADSSIFSMLEVVQLKTASTQLQDGLPTALCWWHWWRAVDITAAAYCSRSWQARD